MNYIWSQIKSRVQRYNDNALVLRLCLHFNIVVPYTILPIISSLDPVAKAYYFRFLNGNTFYLWILQINYIQDGL